MEWRPHLPTSCPPDDAQFPQNLGVYRLIKGDTPEGTDFLSYKEEGRPYDDECIASGLSVYTHINGIETLKKRIKSLKKRKVIFGTLSEDDGVLKNTPSNMHPSHHTWWVPDNLNPLPLFEVMQVEESEL